jgi:hypothetical protein
MWRKHISVHTLYRPKDSLDIWIPRCKACQRPSFGASIWPRIWAGICRSWIHSYTLSEYRNEGVQGYKTYDSSINISIHQLTGGIRKHLTKYIHSRKDFAAFPAAHYRWSLYRTIHGLLGWLQVNIQECWTTSWLKLLVFNVSSRTSEDKWYLRMYKNDIFVPFGMNISFMYWMPLDGSRRPSSQQLYCTEWTGCRVWLWSL